MLVSLLLTAFHLIGAIGLHFYGIRQETPQLCLGGNVATRNLHRMYCTFNYRYPQSGARAMSSSEEIISLTLKSLTPAVCEQKQTPYSHISNSFPALWDPVLIMDSHACS